LKSSALISAPTNIETTLTVLSGPARGTVYRVVSNRVTIGRGPDNDIIIQDDPKCSRNHAEIFLGANGYEIHDVSDRNVVIVNGHETKISRLADNAVFELGQTQFKLSIRNNTNMLPSPHTLQHQGQQRKGTAPKKNSSSFKLILLGLGCLVVWLALTDTNTKDIKLTAEQIAEQELKAAEQVKLSAEEKRRPKDVPLNDIGYRQAQMAYVVGFRDFQKGQFERALASFEACYTLYPQHALCDRYRRLARRRFEELVQHHMVLGRKYRDQNQYAACAASFRNVMVMVKDSTSIRYAEAKANFDACQAQTEERF
jgi:pSer/pThr/pTyr-binding forkhead associated (FHA) protein